MNFTKFISKLISIGSIFILFLICLSIIKYYILDFFSSYGNNSIKGQVYLEVKSSKNNLTIGDRIKIEKNLSIGNQQNNSVIIESLEDIKVEIFIKNNKVFLNNIKDSQSVKVGNYEVQGIVEIYENQIIQISNLSFKLIQE